MNDTNDIDDLPKRFNNLDEFSEELERQTKETQRLQEEVENATKRTMERIGHTFTNNSAKNTPSQLSFMPMFVMDGSSEDNSDILSPCHQSAIQPQNYGLNSLDLEVARSGIPFPGKDVLENAINDYSQQVSELQKQLGETHEQHELQKFTFRQSIIKLQTKLQEVQMEKDAIADLRMKESRKHADLMGKMQAMIMELQSANQCGDQRLLDAEDEAKSLVRKTNLMEGTIHKVCSTLLAYEKRCGNSSYISEDDVGSGQDTLGAAVEKVLQDLQSENHNLHEKLVLAEEQLGSQEQKSQGKAEEIIKEQQERMVQLITSHDQEVAILTEKLSSSRSSASSLRVQLDLLQKQAENQALVHQNQISDLESTLTILRSDLLDAQRAQDKVGSVEKQLAQRQFQVEEAQRGRDQSLQRAEELDTQLSQLTLKLNQACEELSLEKEQSKQLLERDSSHSVTINELRRELGLRSLGVQQLETLVGSLKEDCQAQMEAQLCGEQLQQELQDELSFLREEVEVTRDQLQCSQAEVQRLEAIAEAREAEGKQQQAALEERERELQLRQQEAQHGRARLEETQGRCQALRAETEVLRLKLEDREKVVELLRVQMESTTQMAVQHGRSIDSLHEEKSRLSNQLNEHKLEIKQLRKEVDQRNTRLSVLEQERRQQQTGLSQQSRCVKELTLEKQQLTAKVEVQRMQLLSLAEEQEELKRLLSSKNEEQEGVVVKLRSQLQTARAELDQARTSLRTLEGADGHGMKVAMGMQKQITAKREQIDSLQGRIQLQEETMEKLSQEKHHQILESRRQAQELASAREEKRQLGVEVETLHSMERQLREKVTKLEKALHKMSESFVDCQDHIQMQEQEVMRLKLHHALDLKELQGLNLRPTGSAAGQWNSLDSPAVLAAIPSTAQQGSRCPLELRPQRLKVNPTQELRSVVKELQDVISENPGPHTTTTTTSNNLHRRRSAPERVFTGNTFSEVTKDVRRNASVTKATIELYPSRTLDLDEQNERNINSTLSNESYEASFSASFPSYTSSPQAMLLGRRSPVHSLLTSEPPPDAAGPLKVASLQVDLTSHTCRDLQGKLDSLQNLVEDLQIKNQEMSSMIKGQEKRMRRVKDKGRSLNKQSTE